ncbi:hypothetical protein [Pendulispora albinea]|uniref:Uncharacterized protein n=1 Tax=Pendulispora albinea TaxID=2741071 RepID=A0ABZ2M1M3_9BACT
MSNVSKFSVNDFVVASTSVGLDDSAKAEAVVNPSSDNGRKARSEREGQEQKR